ncbi:MAG: hypothetical protein EB084_26400, partial [Proteobacteria bacterium]|nr:hypothetical protein [Pseudomonadota bacterium]
ADRIFAVDMLAHVRSQVAKIVRLVGEVQKVIDDTDRFVTTTVAHPAQQVRDLLVAVQPLLNLVNSLRSLGIL